MKLFLTLAIATLISGAVSANTLPVLRCTGTEPFWSVSTYAKGVVAFSTPAENGKSFYPFSSIVEAAGTGPHFAFQIASHDVGNKSIRLNVIKGQCSDGMSDKVYAYNVLVEVNDGILYGCCE